MMSNNATQDTWLPEIVQFLRGIGLDCREEKLDQNTFLPGIDIRNGALLYDAELLLYPGDLLHDAGHLAVLSPLDRANATSPSNLNGDLDEGAAEMAAIAWSWAAAQHINLPEEILFHPNGYKGGAQSLADNFSAGRFIGLPILVWKGMTNDSANDGAADKLAYPKMMHWLRQQ